MKPGDRRCRVLMFGLRGFPGVQGGVEAHAEHLCTALAALGCEVEAVVRANHQPAGTPRQWRGVRLTPLYAPNARALEALLHSLLAVLLAAWRRPDVVHIQAIGPALMAPLARALGLRVVVTHHGPDYARQKWGALARAVLRLGEWAGMRGAHARIAISGTIERLIGEKYALEARRIPNGVVLPELPESTGAPCRHGLRPGRYVLMVGRLVPEKRHCDLIEAFTRAALPGWKLALVGGADHPDAYSRDLSRRAAALPQVVMTGPQRGLALSELYTHAGLFVLPSSHEGLPIALLEALSYGLPVLASDIAPHRELALGEGAYFPCGSVEQLAVALRAAAGRPQSAACRAERRRHVATHYDWADVARATLAVYREALGR